MSDDPTLETEDAVWLIGYLADNAPDELLIPPRLANVVELCRTTYNPGQFTVAWPLASLRRRTLP